jgi:hypothetical protein
MSLSSIERKSILVVIVIKNKKVIPRLTVPIKTAISKEIVGNIHTRPKATLIAKTRTMPIKKQLLLL